MTDANVMVPQDLGVAIVAPSGYAPDDAAVARGIERLRELGCRVKNYCASEAKHLRFAGTDAARVEQIHAAVGDSDGRALRADCASRPLDTVCYSGGAVGGRLCLGDGDPE